MLPPTPIDGKVGGSSSVSAGNNESFLEFPHKAVPFGASTKEDELIDELLGQVCTGMCVCLCLRVASTSLTVLVIVIRVWLCLCVCVFCSSTSIARQSANG